MLEDLKIFILIVFIFIIFMCVVFGVYIGIENIRNKINDIKQQKKSKEYEAQGIEQRWAIMGCGFYIEKIHNDESFYLNQDGCFYNTTTNMKEFNFDTMDERSKYIEDNKEAMKSTYGEDVIFKIYTKRVYLGYCKQL